jgi:predicted ribosomally synthesized peptide with SipW-like signal peptide
MAALTAIEDVLSKKRSLRKKRQSGRRRRGGSMKKAIWVLAVSIALGAGVTLSLWNSVEEKAPK